MENEFRAWGRELADTIVEDVREIIEIEIEGLLMGFDAEEEEKNKDVIS